MRVTHQQSSKLIKNNKGLSIITIIIVLSSVSYVLFQGLGVFFSKGRQTKAVNELTISSKTFTNGLFNYTLFALKERWCMDDNWGKDVKCSSTGDMREAISNTRNLERLLWSTSTEVDIKERYLKIYKSYPTINPRLNKLTHSLTISQLESLGRNHPLNIIVDDNIRRCIDKIDIEIEKQNPSIIKPQGDEVYLQIGILGKGKFASFSNCSSVASSLNLRGLVVVYPRTLNQFSLIKAKNLNLASFGASSGAGINFHGPVYVQGDFIIPSKTKKIFNFRDSVIVGEGIFKKDKNAFVPPSYGHSSSSFLGQIQSVSGIYAGVSLDAEKDEGLSKIFGDNYKYPENTNMAACKERQVLKDNFTMTKDSRLFFKRNGNGLIMALSHDNEFRERTILGTDKNGYSIQLLSAQNKVGNGNVLTSEEEGVSKKVKNKPSVEYTKLKKDDAPIMEFKLEVNDKSSDLPVALMGRETDLKIDLVNKEFYQEKLAILTTNTDQYLNRSDLELNAIGANTHIFNDAYNNLASSCNSNILAKRITLPDSCSRVLSNVPTAEAPNINNNGNNSGNNNGNNDGRGRGRDRDRDNQDQGSGWVSNSDSVPVQQVSSKVNCDAAYADNNSRKNDCENALKILYNNANHYKQQENNLRSSISQLSQNVPAVEIKTKDISSNAQALNISLLNGHLLKNPLLDEMNSVSVDMKVYDFAIEKSPNNTDNGLRSKKVELPGPNDQGKDKTNKMWITFEKDRNGNPALAFKTSTGENLLSKNNGNWAMLKKENKNATGLGGEEPPGNFNFGNITYPTNGLTLAQANKLDLECDVDTAAAVPPSWDVSFTDTTAFSWLYNITSPGVSIADPSTAKALNSYVFDAANNDMSIGFYSGVPTRSIVNNCTVKSNIDFIFGFYVCKVLRIEARSNPLNIVGTFVVNDLIIDNSAATAGVNFYSIWQPEAIALLQQKKHLKRENTLAAGGSNDCRTMATSGWNPYLNTDTLADTVACSPARFLYQGANNFNWTTIDPELGITAANGFVATTQSKVSNRYRRYGVNILWQREDYK